jgi:hypothetical protein
MIKPSHSSIERSRFSYISTIDLSYVDGQQTPRVSARDECRNQHEQKDRRNKDEIFHRKLSSQQQHEKDRQKENRL